MQKVDDFFPDVDQSAYFREAEALLLTPEVTARVKSAEAAMQLGTDENSGKYYLVTIWKKVQLDPKNVFVRLALSEPVLGVVSEYLGLAPRLQQLEFFYNLPTPFQRAHSQNWHRDPEDRRQVKLFLYLRDVEEGSGPFEFIAGTHDAGRHAAYSRRKYPYGSYPDPVEVERYFPKTAQRVCAGPAGTLILCDTTGLHRGGYAVTKSRLVFTALYVSDAINHMSKRARNWSLPAATEDLAALSPASRFALHLESRRASGA